MTEQIDSNQAGTFFLAMISLTIASWPVSFALGAYGEVFYTHTLTLWFASLAALYAMLVINNTEDGETYLTWYGAALLSVPTLLMTSQFWTSQPPAYFDVLEWVLFLVSLPYIGYILLSVAIPDAMELTATRLWAWLIIGFLGINGLSFAVGLHNAHFFSCDEFARAGDQPPEGCWPGGG